MHVRHDPLHQLGRARGASDNAGPKMRQITIRKARTVERGDEHGRHPVKHRAALGLGHVHRRFGVEPGRGEDHGGAMCNAAQRAQHHAKTVIHRHRYAHPVMLGQAHL